MNAFAHAAVLVLAGSVLAQQGPEPAAPGEPSALAGPRVSDRAEARPTLVETDYQGLVKRPAATAEEAAIGLLDLSPPERAAVDAVLQERSRLLDAFVSDHLDLLVRLGGAFESGDKRGQLATVLEAFAATREVRARGPLAGQIRGVLAPENQRSFDALLAEYWDAIVAERRAVARKAGKREGRLGIITDERLKSFGREVERAFGRIVDPAGERQFNELLASLGLRPEQESRIRRMAEEFIVRTRFRPTPAQERDFLLQAASTLDQRQLRLLAEYIAEQERAKSRK